VGRQLWAAGSEPRDVPATRRTVCLPQPRRRGRRTATAPPPEAPARTPAPARSTWC